jgi:cell division protein FtsN
MQKITKNNKTIRILKLSLLGLAIIGLTSCTQVRGLFKSGDNTMEKDTALVVPPELRLLSMQDDSKQLSTATALKPAAEQVDNKDYYIVVGTYPNQDQAFDTFVRLSSIGLPYATMESRKTGVGSMLHMVRLGPFHQQSAIDKVKDTLVNDGMSQFKVVVN